MVDEPAGDREEPGAGGAGDDELIVDADIAEDAGPADQVVGEHGALQPGGVGVEVPGWDVFETGAFFEVADRELDHGVPAMDQIN